MPEIIKISLKTRTDKSYDIVLGNNILSNLGQAVKKLKCGNSIFIITDKNVARFYLKKTITALKKGGFVDSKRGVNGGYFMAKPPDTVTIGDVIRFIEGPIEPITCVGKNNYEECKDFVTCVFRDIWGQVYNAISLVIDTVTFAELSRRVQGKMKEKESYTYNI